MAIYQLIKSPVFPPPEVAEPEGLLAVGGDLSPERLLLAYSSGIFPWYNETDPILWWSPDPRCILEPDQMKVSRSLARTLRREIFTVTFDRCFRQVIEACGGVRAEKGGGTWLSSEMIEAYCRLHRLGYAHSVECWRGDLLAGGLYGVALGRCFFGESMFHRQTDASKVAFVTLVRRLMTQGVALIDCQLPTEHLASLGAVSIPRSEFLRRLPQGGVTPSTAPPLPSFVL